MTKTLVLQIKWGKLRSFEHAESDSNHCAFHQSTHWALSPTSFLTSFCSDHRVVPFVRCNGAVHLMHQSVHFFSQKEKEKKGKEEENYGSKWWVMGIRTIKKAYEKSADKPYAVKPLFLLLLLLRLLLLLHSIQLQHSRDSDTLSTCWGVFQIFP